MFIGFTWSYQLIIHLQQLILFKFQHFFFFLLSFFYSRSIEIAQLTSCDSGIAETPETDDSVSTQKLIIVLILSTFTAGVSAKYRFYLCDLFVIVSSCPQSQSLSTALRCRRKPCELDFEMTKLISNGAYG